MPELTLAAVLADLDRAGTALARVLASPAYDPADPGHAAVHTAQGALATAYARVCLIGDPSAASLPTTT